MKTTIKLIIAVIALLLMCRVEAQTVEYKTFIYVSPDLADDIQRVNESQDDTRRFDVDLLNATVGAAKGIGSGYISALVDLGVNSLGNLITRNSRLKQEWEDMVKAENKWSTKITSVQDVKDFYSKPSTAGALDPLNMNFDGIGCMRMEGNDTVFFISCHIDRSKLNRIVNHSKFELVIDTLILSPTHSNLPNSRLPLDFSFEERKDYNLNMDIKLSSSWFTDAIELHSNETLGEFKISVPVAREDLDANGFLRYVRKNDDAPRYHIIGESFIVPRSYMGYRDANGKYKNIWGTGQYKLEIDLSETCDVTPEYRASWKADRKKRKKMVPSQDFFSNVWQTVSSQKWDEITKSWIITTISAPAGVLSKEIINDLGLSSASPAASAAKAPSSAPKMK